MKIKSIRIENFKGIKNPVEFEFAPITLLFGPNSSGKSTIIHALSYLCDVINFHDLNSDTTQLGEGVMNLGGFKSFVNNHDLEKSIIYEVDLDMDVDEVPLVHMEAADWYKDEYSFKMRRVPERDVIGRSPNRFDLVGIFTLCEQIKSSTLRIEIAWSFFKNKPYVKSVTLLFNNEKFLVVTATQFILGATITEFNIDHPICIKEVDKGDDVPPSILDSYEEESNDKFLSREPVDEDGTKYRTHSSISIRHTEDALVDWRNKCRVGDIWKNEVGEEDRYRYGSYLSSLIHVYLCGTLEIIGLELRGMKYLGPLRKVPERNFISRTIEADGCWADGSAAWDKIFQRDARFTSDVNHWLASDERLNSGYEVKRKESKNIPLDSDLMAMLQVDDLNINREKIRTELSDISLEEKLVIKDLRRNVEVQCHDVGAGISQVIPVIVGALDDEISIFMIEQPELHIHPKLQVELADLFIKAVKESDKHFILETHSEHIILRLLRRIRESDGQDKAQVCAKDVIVYYIDVVGDETKVRKIRIDNQGRFLQRWPKGGFFPERSDEVFG
jgi:predicted ATPase